MSIDISPQLSSVLAARRMTEDDLARQIRERFDLAADAAMIAQLARQETLHGTNVELALAAAQVLGISLDDLFRSAASPASSDTPAVYFRGYSQEEIAALLDDQTYGDLASDSQKHLDNLLAEYGRTLYDRHLRAYADERGIPIEQAREAVTNDLAASLRWQDEFEADTQRQELVIKRAQKCGE